ncbi:hypothetical protein FE257_006923 [Aspergillus nanangensis]|uniref:FAD-binding domain-containing protein n=1 Tax=Aspergillus nanangensis TaxID=2582783 RepID=A0AAD4CQ96_ASPNN|nr:hypothetical protein FE257_006923 [Aspergillus nanangensis]
MPAHSDCSIAIIGAGIGGLALAIGLLQQNVPFTIYESAAQFDAIGAGIGLGPNALRAMELMDSQFAAMYDQIKVGNTTPGRVHEQFEILSAGEGFGVHQGWHGGSVSHPAFHRSSVHRRDLLEVMKQRIPEGRICFNKRVVGIENAPSGPVVLSFADGATATVDAVVGCDGIKGMTRRFVLGDEYAGEVVAKYANTYAYRHVASMATAREILGSYAADAKWYMNQGKGLAMYPISKGSEVNMVVFIHDPKPWSGEQSARQVSHEAMVADLEGLDSRLVKVLQNATPVRWPLFHHPDTPIYANGRICILGDAAHASSPSQAAGAGQGLEDALVLSRLLGLVQRPGQLEAAFQAYGSVRQPRAQTVVQQSYEVMLKYFLVHPDSGDDLQKLTDDANERLPLLWWHDLEADSISVKAHTIQTNIMTNKEETSPVPDNPEPPQSQPYSIYTRKEKWILVTLVAFAGLFSPLPANIYFPAIPKLTQVFNRSVEDMNLTVTIYLVFQGAGPMLWGPLADKWGRRPLYLVCLSILAASCVGLALCPPSAYWLLLLLRALQAGGCASTIALGAGVIGDIAAAEERGGPLLPVVGRDRNKHRGIMDDVTSLRITMGSSNPFRLLLYPDVALTLTYTGIIHAVNYTITTTISSSFTEIYPTLSETSIGLCYLAGGGGMIIGSTITGRLLNWDYRRVKKKYEDSPGSDNTSRPDNCDNNTIPIEYARLRMTPVLLIVLVGCYSSGVIACTNLVRCSLAAILVSVIDRLTRRLGFGWTYSILGGICALLLPLIYAEIKLGPRWRGRRRLGETSLEN